MSSTATSAAINLLNTIVGSGMLAMSYGIKANGIVLGLFVIFFSASTSSFGLYLQNRASKFAPEGHASFFALSQLTYPSLSVVFDLAIAVKCFGVGVSYLVVIGDLMPKIVESILGAELEHLWLLSRNFWISLFMLIIVPLSFLRRLDSLKYASMVALSSVAYLVILVIVHFFRHDMIDKGPVRVLKPQGFVSVISAFPIFVFAYTCHQNMFSLINELNDKSTRNINKVIFSAIGTALTLYVCVGVSGYLTFGDHVSGNIIAMYPHSKSSTIGRIAIVVLVMLSYPLQCHPCRASVNHVIHYFKHGANTSMNKKLKQRFYSRLESNTSNATNSTITSSERQSLLNWQNDELVEEGGVNEINIVPLGTTKFIVLTSSILVLSYLVAMTVSSLEKVLGFVGSTGSTSISFILPGIFGYKLIGSNDQPLSLTDKLIKYGALLLSFWGLIVMVVSLTLTLFLGAGH